MAERRAIRGPTSGIKERETSDLSLSHATLRRSGPGGELRPRVVKKEELVSAAGTGASAATVSRDAPLLSFDHGSLKTSSRTRGWIATTNWNVMTIISTILTRMTKAGRSTSEEEEVGRREGVGTVQGGQPQRSPQVFRV